MSSEEHQNKQVNEYELELCVKLLKDLRVRVVAFDMDQTAVAMHSRGELRRGEPLAAFCQRATPDFVQLVPRLHRHGFGLAIATHSDEAEYRQKQDTDGNWVDPSTHILGSELAAAMLKDRFDPTVANDFAVVAFNPRARGIAEDDDVNKIKRYHVQELIRRFHVKPDEVVLIDDTKEVIEDCSVACGVRAVQVDSAAGFRLSDLLDYLKEAKKLNHILSG